MKKLSYVFLTIVISTFIATILFGLYFYFCYALKYNLIYPFKETLSMVLSFLGTFGTLISIWFSFYFYMSQRKKDKQERIEQKQKEDDDTKEFILRNKPNLTIEVSKQYISEDKNSQVGLAVDLTIKNYLNSAHSFGLAYDDLQDKGLLVEFKENDFSNTLLAGESSATTILITLAKDTINPPELSDIDLYLKLVYLDKLNNSVEDYYRLQQSDRHQKLIVKGPIKSEVLTVSGKVIEFN